MALDMITEPKSAPVLTLAERAGREPPARGRAPLALAMEAADLLDAIVDAATGQAGDGPAHQRFAQAWGLTPDGADLVRRALVLLADHELNASTFATRVAASTGALSGACAQAINRFGASEQYSASTSLTLRAKGTPNSGSAQYM